MSGEGQLFKRIQELRDRDGPTISSKAVEKVLLEAKQEFPHRPMQEKLVWYQRYATIMEEWFEKWFGVV